jgi:hypothetical protein
MTWRDIADRVNKAVVKTFGEYVTWTPFSTGIGTQVFMHFESAFFRIDTQTTAGITTEDPHCYIRIADLPSGLQPDTGDRVTAQGETYEVYDAAVDGYGAIKVFLKKVS